ncbi:MAG: Hsp20/alpha crystallin family protein [Candidatus Obscuribacter sp.]|nr:Hsp20/alpha crystallin family protein [Candidatus Obscuribacter sp.]MBK9622018.1 Hsp20/alpha crystallin family protein [Candidatus Obscuribacter sp.]MBP6351442.1 Hsp20/alpha crystallin family protein [Candidatus Obscuribacter sp.]
MFKDPDSEWLMRNFDIMSSDPERSWAFPLGTGSYIPRVDIDTTDNLLKLTAEVPGIDEKNLDVTVTDEAVSIKGEKQAEEKKTNSKDFQSIERHYGSFERTVALPCKIDKDKAEAKLKNGILTVTLPRLLEEKSPAKRLTIGRQ